MSRFTKGPITVVDGGQDVFIKFPSGINICVGDAIYNRDRSLEIANLLAAAPDMYEAIKAINDKIDSGEYLRADDPECDDVKQALAKAEGK